VLVTSPSLSILQSTTYTVIMAGSKPNRALIFFLDLIGVYVMAFKKMECVQPRVLLCQLFLEAFYSQALSLPPIDKNQPAEKGGFTYI